MEKHNCLSVWASWWPVGLWCLIVGLALVAPVAAANRLCALTQRTFTITHLEHFELGPLEPDVYYYADTPAGRYHVSAWLYPALRVGAAYTATIYPCGGGWIQAVATREK